MFLVFAWKAGQQLGGVHDFLKAFPKEDDALAFAERLLQTDEAWEFHITDDGLNVAYETSTHHVSPAVWIENSGRPN
jgi:hypothetical protein